MKNFIAVIFLTLCISCEDFWIKEDDLNMKLDALPVLHSFINPEDSLIRVRLTYAEPTVGYVPDDQEYFDPILNAEIKITNYFNDAQFIYTDEFFHYADYIIHQDSFSISEGGNYKISLTTQEDKTANCECTVPQGKVKEVSLKKLENSSDGDFYAFEFRDNPGEKNYYAVALAQYSWDNENNVERQTVLEIISDELMDGQKIISKYYSMGGYNPRALLFEVDENYYNYHFSLNQYYQIRDNPFAEPYTIYSNVEGGFGVMGCYTVLAEVKI